MWPHLTPLRLQLSGNLTRSCYRARHLQFQPANDKDDDEISHASPVCHKGFSQSDLNNRLTTFNSNDERNNKGKFTLCSMKVQDTDICNDGRFHALI